MIVAQVPYALATALIICLAALGLDKTMALLRLPRRAVRQRIHAGSGQLHL